MQGLTQDLHIVRLDQPDGVSHDRVATPRLGDALRRARIAERRELVLARRKQPARAVTMINQAFHQSQSVDLLGRIDPLAVVVAGWLRETVTAFPNAQGVFAESKKERFNESQVSINPVNDPPETSPRQSCTLDIVPPRVLAEAFNDRHGPASRGEAVGLSWTFERTPKMRGCAVARFTQPLPWDFPAMPVHAVDDSLLPHWRLVMNAPERFLLPDIQASVDLRQLAIHKVGVKGLRYPLALLDASGKVQNTVARLSMSVGLPPDVKGTHMSRFVEILERRRPPLNVNRLLRIFDDMLLRLDAQSGEIELAFPLLHQQGRPGLGRREPA
jgi:hypothetical protein